MRKVIICFILFVFSSVCYSQADLDSIESSLEKDKKEAILDYTKAIEINPNDANAYFSRATIKFKFLDFTGGISDLNKVIEINPKSAQAYYYRGFYKNALNQREEGCSDLNKAGELGYKRAYEIIKGVCN